jgi:hypothetical protein
MCIYIFFLRVIHLWAKEPYLKKDVASLPRLKEEGTIVVQAFQISQDKDAGPAVAVVLNLHSLTRSDRLLDV